jgi:hypothetical protein
MSEMIIRPTVKLIHLAYAAGGADPPTIKIGGP